jgi:hypothetical protein
MTTTKPKSNSVITTSVNEALTRIEFTVKDAGTLVLDLERLHRAILARATVHGMTQRISDAAAISRNPETGKPASAMDKLSAMRALVDHYQSGTEEWSRKRSEPAAYTNGLLSEVLKRAYPNKDAERIAAYLKGLKPSERAALLVSPKLAPIAEQVRAEAAASSKVDTDALLAGLDADDSAPAAMIAE